MSRLLPKVGISTCLLGENVRHDGGHKRQPDLLREFEGKVEWVAVCPEVEVGLGTPREPIRLEGDRLVTIDSHIDITDRMREWAQTRLAGLPKLCGYIFKSGSPSCGLESTPIHGAAELGSGAFATELRARFPGLPLAEETALADHGARQAFLDRVYSAYARPRAAAP